jgi:hypothetical protein
MKTNALFTLLMVAAVAFMMGCEATPGGGQKISSSSLKIAGTYKGAMFTGETEFPGSTTFKAGGGKLSGTYELTAGGEKVTGTLSDFSSTGKNKFKCRWKDPNGVGDFNLTFSDDLSSFKGTWDNDANDAGGAWNGKK